MSREEIAWIMAACAALERGDGPAAASLVANAMLTMFLDRFPARSNAGADKVRRGVRK